MLPPPTPLPRGDQLAPSHLAMLLAGAPPAVVNLPAAKSASPPPSSKTVRASTPTGTPVIPLPTADQPEPSHLAMLLAATPPAVVNCPPT